MGAFLRPRCNVFLDMKQKALAYIYRSTPRGDEVLVFDHEEKYGNEINPQVPAGTIEEGESPKDAVLREVFEESGLEFAGPTSFLGEFAFKDIKRYVFTFKSKGLPDNWDHLVKGTGTDKGMIFSYYWVSIEEAKARLVSEMGSYL